MPALLSSSNAAALRALARVDRICSYLRHQDLALTATAPIAKAQRSEVRTGVSVPFSEHMRGRDATPASAEAQGHHTSDTTVAGDPFAMGATGRHLMMRHVLLAPVVVAWRYRVANANQFRNWLSTREILFNTDRMALDPETTGIRYGGTFRVAGIDDAAMYKTFWGFLSEGDMKLQEKLATDPSVRPTIVQYELMEFMGGLKRFIGEAGVEHFSQEVLTAAAVT